MHKTTCTKLAMSVCIYDVCIHIHSKRNLHILNERNMTGGEKEKSENTRVGMHLVELGTLDNVSLDRLEAFVALASVLPVLSAVLDHGLFVLVSVRSTRVRTVAGS